MVYRVYVEKRVEYAVEAHEILSNLKTQLKLESLTNVKLVNRYDVQGLDSETFAKGVNTILSEPMVDDVYFEEYDALDGIVFGIELYRHGCLLHCNTLRDSRRVLYYDRSWTQVILFQFIERFWPMNIPPPSLRRSEVMYCPDQPKG